VSSEREIEPAVASVKDDGELIEQIESGMADAFEELYERYHVRAYRLARSVCRDDGRAEEAVQEAFVSIWRKPATYQRARGTVASWLLSVVHHRAVDVARSNTRHTSRRADDGIVELPRVSGLADHVVDRDDATRLSDQLQRLPGAQREVIALAFFGQLTHAEIAVQLDLPPGTIKGRMRLGLQKLRVDIEHVAACARWHTELAKALHAGDFERARGIVHDVGHAMPAIGMLDDILAPAMHSIGALWRQGDITIADEHLATATCHRLLAEISPALQVAPAKTRETVLLATPAPEQHTLGLLMANDVLYGAGYDTVLLGAGIPDSTLRAALIRHRPAIVALSSTMASPQVFASTAAVIHETLPATHLVVGGAGAQRVPGGVQAHYVDRLDALLATVKGLLRPRKQIAAVAIDEQLA
jgi:RNA polymerase sigma-70 factor, ECF subfamily